MFTTKAVAAQPQRGNASTMIVLGVLLMAACIPRMVVGGAVYETKKGIFPSPDAYKLSFTPITPPNAPVTLRAGAGPFAGTISPLLTATLQPCSVIAAHVHARGTEVGYVVKGTIEAGIAREDGTTVMVKYKAGQGFVFPQGSLHFVRNAGCSKVELVITFDHPDAGTVFAGEGLLSFDDKYKQTAFKALQGPAPNLFLAQPCPCK